MNNMTTPSWGLYVMGIGLIAFIGLVTVSIRRNHSVKRSLFASPYALWIIIFTVLPVLLVLLYAFRDADGNLTLDNFKAFWDSNHIMREQLRSLYGDEVAATVNRGYINISTLTYSIWMAFLCTVVSLLLGYPAALFMADRGMKLGASVVVLFIIPMWMNFLLRTVAWMTLLEDGGVINTFLGWFGIGPLHLLYTEQAVLLGMVYNYLPFMVFPIYSSLNKMDPSLSEAAADLGCNSWRTLYKVTMPLSIPGVISGITMVFMPSVTTFFISRMLGGGKTQMFGDLIETTFLTAGNWNLGSALSLVMMVLILISLAILRKADPNGEGGGI